MLLCPAAVLARCSPHTTLGRTPSTLVIVGSSTSRGIVRQAFYVRVGAPHLLPIAPALEETSVELVTPRALLLETCLLSATSLCPVCRFLRGGPDFRWPFAAVSALCSPRACLLCLHRGAGGPAARLLPPDRSSAETRLLSVISIEGTPLLFLFPRLSSGVSLSGALRLARRTPGCCSMPLLPAAVMARCSRHATPGRYSRHAVMAMSRCSRLLLHTAVMARCFRHAAPSRCSGTLYEVQGALGS